MKIPDAKAAVDKEWEELEGGTGVAADESQMQKKRWSMKQGMRVKLYNLRR